MCTPNSEWVVNRCLWKPCWGPAVPRRDYLGRLDQEVPLLGETPRSAQHAHREVLSHGHSGDPIDAPFSSTSPSSEPIAPALPRLNAIWRPQRK